LRGLGDEFFGLIKIAADDQSFDQNFESERTAAQTNRFFGDCFGALRLSQFQVAITLDYQDINIFFSDRIDFFACWIIFKAFFGLLSLRWLACLVNSMTLRSIIFLLSHG